MAGYDIEGARAAGVSDADIAATLAPKLNYDLEGARKAGISDTDIATALAGKVGATGKPTPANAGVGNLAATALGLPVDAVTNLINLGIAGYGSATGTTPELINAPVGSAEWIRQKMRSTGVPGLSPDNPNPNDKMGTAAYDFTSRGGIVPGAALPAAASMVAEKIGGPQWAGVGSMLPAAGITAFNAARAPGLATAEAQNVVRDKTLRPAQDAGYVLPPSAVQPSGVGNAVESFAGKAAISQEAQLKNQQVTNGLVRQELKVPDNTPLTEDLLGKLRDQASQPYRDVAAMSSSADKALQALRDARAEAKDQWRHWDMQGVPEAKRQAVALDQKAASLETYLERQAQLSGKPELVQQLRDARTYIAKTFDVERALNVGNGNVDARIIGRAIDRGRPLTGNLETIGRFAEAFNPFVREASRVPAPGVSALNWPAAAMLGVEGHNLMGPGGAALATLPFARGGVRAGLLSDRYQQNFNRPDYTPNMQAQGPLQMLLQSIIAGEQK